MTKAFPVTMAAVLSVALAGCTATPAPAPPATTETPGTTVSERPPNTTSAPAPVEEKAPVAVGEKPPVAPAIGPDGLDGLRLGMSFAEAKAAGFVRGRESAVDGCVSYDLYHGGGRDGLVFITPGRGVEAIAPDRPVRTPEDVTIGSTGTEVKAAYPDFPVDLLAELGHLGVQVPGNAQATYRLGFENHRVVSQISLQLTDQACYE